jgi:hypothetical protein
MPNEGAKNIEPTRTSSSLQLSPWMQKRLLKDHFHSARTAAPERRLGERTSRLMRRVIGRQPLLAKTPVILPLSRPWATRSENRAFLPPSWQPMTLLVSSYGRSPAKSETSGTPRFERTHQFGTYSHDMQVNPFSETPSPVRRTATPSRIPVAPPVSTPATQAVKRKVIRGKVEEMTPVVPPVMPQPEHPASPVVSPNISSQTVQIQPPETPKTASGPGSKDETGKLAGRSGSVSGQHPEVGLSISSGQPEKAIIVKKSLSSDAQPVARENSITSSPVVPKTEIKNMSATVIPAPLVNLSPAAVQKSGTSAGEDQYAGARTDFPPAFSEEDNITRPVKPLHNENQSIVSNNVTAPHSPPQPKGPDDQPVRRKGFFAGFTPIFKQIFRRRSAPAPSKNMNLDSPVAAKKAKAPQTEAKSDQKPLVKIFKAEDEATPDLQPKTDITDEAAPAPTEMAESPLLTPLSEVEENLEVQRQSTPYPSQTEPSFQQSVQETDPLQNNATESSPSSDSQISNVRLTADKPELTAQNSTAVNSYSGPVVRASAGPLTQQPPVSTLKPVPVQRVYRSTELPLHRRIRPVTPLAGNSQLSGKAARPGLHAPPALDLPLASPVRIKSDSTETQEIGQFKPAPDVARSASPGYQGVSHPAVTPVNRAVEFEAASQSPSTYQTAQETTDYKALARDIYPYLKRMIMIEKERFPDP